MLTCKQSSRRYCQGNCGQALSAMHAILACRARVLTNLQCFWFVYVGVVHVLSQPSDCRLYPDVVGLGQGFCCPCSRKPLSTTLKRSARVTSTEGSQRCKVSSSTISSSCSRKIWPAVSMVSFYDRKGRKESEEACLSGCCTVKAGRWKDARAE